MSLFSSSTATGTTTSSWAELRAVCRDRRALDEWMKKWVLDVGDHEGYLKQLGSARLQALQAEDDPGWLAR